jgi:UDP-N-acetylmuramoylalanine--D-glutamate ligase
LIAGGSDKGLDISPFGAIAACVAAMYLLAGTGTDRIIDELRAAGRQWKGPYDSMEAAVAAARDDATRGDVVVLSPGCASFGMFKNEFHRGDNFRVAVTAEHHTPPVQSERSMPGGIL